MQEYISHPARLELRLLPAQGEMDQFTCRRNPSRHKPTSLSPNHINLQKLVHLLCLNIFNEDCADLCHAGFSLSSSATLNSGIVASPYFITSVNNIIRAVVKRDDIYLTDRTRRGFTLNHERIAWARLQHMHIHRRARNAHAYLAPCEISTRRFSAVR